MSKWIKFHTSISPIDVANLNGGQNTICSDWERLSNSGSMVIDGQNLSSLRTKSGARYDFQSEEGLKKFFNEIILKDLPIEKKELALKFLFKYFHQGGLMFPVSTPLTGIFFDSKNRAMLQPSAQEIDIDRKLSIITTRTGFKIQEIYSTKKLIGLGLENDVLDKKYEKLAMQERDADDLLTFTPDKGNNFVIKAGVTIDVDFSEVPNLTHSPTAKIKIESSAISYGNSQIRAAIDSRSFVNIIIDPTVKFINLIIFLKIYSVQIL